VVVPCRGAYPHVESLLKSLRSPEISGAFEIILVDDASPLRLQDVLAAQIIEAEAKVVRLSSRHGFLGAIETGVGETDSDVLIVANSDTQADSSAVLRLAHQIHRQSFAAVGPSSNAAGFQSVPRFRKNLPEKILRQTPRNRLKTLHQQRLTQSALLSEFGEETTSWPLIHGFFIAIDNRLLVQTIQHSRLLNRDGFAFEFSLAEVASREGLKLGFQPGTFVPHMKSKSYGALRRWKNISAIERTLSDEEKLEQARLFREVGVAREALDERLLRAMREATS